MWPLGFEDLEFKEAMDWFLSRTLVTRAEWDAMEEASRKKAFMVSGVAQLDVIADVWKALERAITDGTTLKDFKANIGAKLEAAWAGSVDDPATRLETIFRTNIQLAYSAGRYRQLTNPDALESRPYWMYNAIFDDRTTPVCKACDGKILPADHAFWRDHVPPLHFNCRSALIALSAEDARERGIGGSAPTEPAQTGFGKPPGKDDWAPDPASYPPELWKLYTEKELPPKIELPKPPTPAENILHEKVGNAKGSNEGGFYVGRDGVKRYVKFYNDAAQAHGEHLANQVYRDLGFEAPASAVFDHDGRTAYASVVVEGAKTLGTVGVTPERAKAVMEGFVADVLTANWDAVGMSKDNILVLADGRLMRVDNGGAFLMRAKAGRKGADALYGITEWEKLRDRSVNAAYADIASAAGMATDAKLKPLAVKSIKAVLALREKVGSWSAYVEKAIPGMPAGDKAAVIAMLESRATLLEAKLKELTARKPRAARKPKGTIVFDFGSAAGEKVREKLHALKDTFTRNAFYGELFAKACISDDDFAGTRSDISGWTGEYRLGSHHVRMYGAFAKITSNETDHATDAATTERLARVLPTRKERWQHFLAAVGEKPIAPTHIRAYRGVGGSSHVIDVARAWADDTVEFATVASHELASWSMDKKCATGFANGADSSESVIYQWDVPLASTSHDQIVDDAGFISSFFSEHEVIAGPGHDKGASIPKQNIELKFDGEKYTYKDREKLLHQLRKRGLL